MLRISQLKLPVEHTEAQLKKKLLKTAHIKEQDLKQFFIRKRSVDGRKKPELYYVYTVDLIVANEEHVKKISKGKLQTVQEKNYHIPEHGAKKLRKRPVVIGSGPAGLFCAYLLAFEGYEPLVIERGAPVRTPKGCRTILERRHIKYCLKRTVWRGWCRHFFRREIKYSCQR